MDILVFSKAFPDRIPRIICFFNSTAIVGTRSAQGSAQGLKGQSRAGGPLLAHFEVSQLLFGGTGGCVVLVNMKVQGDLENHTSEANIPISIVFWRGGG